MKVIIKKSALESIEQIADYISSEIKMPETALRYAKENGQLPMAELALYMVHGFLHLNAHEDGTELQRTRMHAVQDVIWRQALDALPV